MFYDTIAAICSGLTTSGINVIRISGDRAFSIADSVFKSISGKTVPSMRSHSVNYGHIIENGHVIDEVLLLKMNSPKTYTCENVVEIDCHGGIVVTKKVLNAVLNAGARLAEPGEFTKRAFLNGRIDLSQAEAVIDIINSKTEIAVNNSIAQLRGDIKEEISSIRNEILSCTAFIEAALDDPEHISIEGYDRTLLVKINDLLARLRKMLSSSNSGRFLRDGIGTAIIGRPNAGKSSLLNSILGTDRAIVTDIEGTTRDTLEEYVDFDGILLRLIDTAGIRETENIIEKIGVQRAIDAAGEADLILYVIDSSKGFSYTDAQMLDMITDKKVILVFNKSDIFNNEYSIDELVNKYSHPHVIVSALTGNGISDIKALISDMFFDGKINTGEDIIITNIRHKNLLSDAVNSLSNVIDSINNGLPEDFYTIDMMAAYTSLGLITGDNIEDDLADKIFSDFCMGK